MSKHVKEMVMAEIRDRIGDPSDMLVVDSSRLDAISTNRFRLALREKDFSIFTVKNSLAKKTLNEVGVNALDSILQGPSTLVWGGKISSLSPRKFPNGPRNSRDWKSKGEPPRGRPCRLRKWTR